MHPTQPLDGPAQAAPPPSTLIDEPDAAALASFTSLVRAHLASQSASDLSAIEAALSAVPSSARPAYERARADARREWHAQTSSRRLGALHKQLLSITSQQAAAGGSARPPATRKERKAALKALVGRFADRSAVEAVGCRPFFAALGRVLEAQTSYEAGGERLVWRIDDATLVECAGDAFREQAVSLLVGTLGFVPLTLPDETDGSASDANSGPTPILRPYLFPAYVSNPEAHDLFRQIPASSYVGRWKQGPVKLPAWSSSGLHHAGQDDVEGRSDGAAQPPRDEEEVIGDAAAFNDDGLWGAEESFSTHTWIELPTGGMARSGRPREQGWRGGIVERLTGWLWSFVGF